MQIFELKNPFCKVYLAKYRLFALFSKNVWWIYIKVLPLQQI